MIRAANQNRRAFPAAFNLIPELSSINVSEDDRKRAEKISKFLGTAASVTDYHSGKTFVTLSFSMLGFKLLQKIQ